MPKHYPPLHVQAERRTKYGLWAVDQRSPLSRFPTLKRPTFRAASCRSTGRRDHFPPGRCFVPPYGSPVVSNWLLPSAVVIVKAALSNWTTWTMPAASQARAMDNNPRVKAGKKGSVPALGILAPNISTLYSALEHALVVFLTWRITFHQGRLRARYLEWSRLLSLETTMF
jgi:hypothetical protein